MEVFAEKRNCTPLKLHLAGVRVTPSSPGRGALSPEDRLQEGAGRQGVSGPQGSGLHTQFCFPFSVMTLPFGPALTGSGDRVAVFLSRTTSSENWLASWVSPLDAVPDLGTCPL